uniref:LOW QUALITY PROTEIN: uncharacterized protein LOC117368452 n=1 Tax=Geotrypetes seraphini TaxID=260995 RepID=A0A6P8SHF0_GEOSA|nr:LOW QUALITY PROTEIN: uncharacterized protein LOC117368452 [Geotrypetes seraphini]
MVFQRFAYFRTIYPNNKLQNVTSFILFGMSDLPEHQILLFLIFLILYLLNLLGNIVMITLIVIDPQLKTPMYFFLCNLSFADMCLATVNVPNLLANFFSKSKTISYSGCIAQMHFFFTTGIAECFLLSAMAYDRYVAICNPLHYTLVMNRKLCNLIAAGTWTVAYLHSLLHTLLMSQLFFCGPNTIDHFFCDIIPLLKLSCSELFTNEIVIFIDVAIVGCVAFLCILIYIRILIAILGIQSSEGRCKVFSTCSSHLVVLTLFFGSAYFTYLQPSSSYIHERNRIMTVIYTVVTPMLNPFIYSLRNNDVKEALRRTIGRRLIPVQTCIYYLKMRTKNHTIVTSFILFGMSDLPEHRILLFLAFLVLYLLNLLGNIVMITLIVNDAQLKTPMYFFLCNLSFADMCLATVNVPNLLANFFSKSKTISYSGCIAQMHFFLITGIAECFLLSAMAYDRYVAICNPLHYTLVMNRKLCNLIAAGCWTVAYLNSLLHTLLMSQLSFCGPNTIDHLFCDLLPLLKLSCSDISTNEIVIFIAGGIVGCSTFLCILISYICIFITILSIRSSEGRRKAFSTCSSHLIVVTLYFGSAYFTYLQPSSSYTHERNRVMTVMYTVVTPMLNPYIYSLRNNDVKGALRRIIARRLISVQTCIT